jgi:HK97 family phage major capsid protein
MSLSEVKSMIESQGESWLKAHRDVIERVDQLETMIRRPGVPLGGKDGEGDRETKAFNAFLRRGPETMEPFERKLLRVSDDASGGFLAHPVLSNEVLRLIALASPLRQAAMVRTGTGPSFIQPRQLDSVEANWLAEVEPAPESTLTFGQIEVPAHRLAAYVEVSNVLLDDAAVDLDALLATDFAEQFARAEGAAFTTGNAAGKPRGLLTYPSGTTADAIEQIPSGHATELTADSLIQSLQKLRPEHRVTASWLMNSATLGAVRLLKSTAGEYVWRPGIEQGQPDRLLGRPVLEDPQMPDIAAGSLPVAVGDFRRGYTIFDRVQLSVVRDPFSKARSGVTCFTATRRVGGAVVEGRALKLVRVSAS